MVAAFDGNKKGPLLKKIQHFGVDADGVVDGFGLGYELIGVVMDEVTGGADAFFRKWKRRVDELGRPAVFSNAGKVMGYAALGKPRDEWLGPMKAFLKRPWEFVDVSIDYGADAGAPFLVKEGRGRRPLADDDVASLFPDARNNRTAARRDLAATLQRAFEDLTVDAVAAHVLSRPPDAYDGVALSGGCALNVIAPRPSGAFAMTFEKTLLQKKIVFVSPSWGGDGRFRRGRGSRPRRGGATWIYAEGPVAGRPI